MKDNSKAAASPYGDSTNWNQVLLLTDGHCPTPEHSAWQVEEEVIPFPTRPLSPPPSYQTQLAIGGSENQLTCIVTPHETLYYQHRIVEFLQQSSETGIIIISTL